MFGGTNGPSLADIAAVTGNGNNNDGFGNNGWWALIIILALFSRNGGLFGNDNCQGNGGGSYQGALTRSDLCQDMNFQELQSGVRGISDSVNLGFANLNSTICSQQYETAGLINRLTTTILQNMNSLQALFNSCCCDLKNLFAQAEYNRATDTCAITRAIQDAARDIIQNDNANYRTLHDEQIAIQMQQKDTQIGQLQAALNRCDTQAIADSAVTKAVDQFRQQPPYYGPCFYQQPYYGYYYAVPQVVSQQGCCCGSNYNFG